MRRWDHEIDIAQEYGEYENDGDFAKYGKAVIAKLKKLGVVEEVYIQELRDAVESDDVDEWDDAMEDLYDWADENNVWIRTT